MKCELQTWFNKELYSIFTAPSVNQVFTVDFETKPLYVEADYSLNLNVQPVEIVYDEVSRTSNIGLAFCSLKFFVHHK